MKNESFLTHGAGAPAKEVEALPASCPCCKSAAIVTSAKKPSAESYWRCTSCGEVWNNARRHTQRYINY